MDIIMMDQQPVKHVMQLVLNAQDPQYLNVQNVKLLTGLMETHVKHVMFLVMVVLVLATLIVKLAVLQELNTFCTYLLTNVLYKPVVTTRTSLHLLLVNYFVMSDQVLLE
jgi:hypothetical protein